MSRNDRWWSAGAGFLAGLLVGRAFAASADEPAVPTDDQDRVPSNPAVAITKTEHYRRPRHVVVLQMVLGVGLVYGSFLFYRQTVAPLRPPQVTGVVQAYTRDASVPEFLSVQYGDGTEKSGETPVRIALTFLGTRSTPSVAWALVFYGDSCIAEGGRCLASAADARTTALPPGSQVRIVRIASTPFAANRKDQSAQIISGVTALDTANGIAGASVINGAIPVRVATRSGPTSDLTLPSYGRLPTSPVFDFPDRPGALDLSIPGDWHRPLTFQVDVDAGQNDSGSRVDIASPPITDPIRLHWTSGDAIRVVLQRTDLQRQAAQQVVVFLLGAVVGAGASSALSFLEAGLSALWVKGVRAWR